MCLVSISQCRAVLAAAVLTLLSGCAAYDRTTLVSAGPEIEFKADHVEEFRKQQDKVIRQLIGAVNAPAEEPPAGAPAGVGATPVARASTAANAPAVATAASPASAPAAVAGVIPGTTGVTWDQVIRAGMDYADVRCETYLHGLFRLDRDKKAAVAQTGLLGTAAAGVQAAVGAAAKEVAITAILFGLAGSTIDNYASSLLYQLEPSSVRALVKKQQERYRDKLGEGYRTRPDAMAALRGYAVLCVPANVEAEVNLAVKEKEPETKPAEPAKGKPPVVTNASIPTAASSFGPDDNSNRLDAFVNPAGKVNADNERKLLAYMRANGLPNEVGTTSFIFGGRYRAERKAAIEQFGLK